MLFSHRPDQSVAADTKEIAKRSGIPYRACQSDRDIGDECDIYIVAGSGLLSKECLQNKRILNAHPGIIPQSRGLDAFKWALLKDHPLGVSLHYIDENVDCGEIVAVVETPVFETDTLHTLARRHYENEIATLTHFKEYLQNPRNPFSHLPLCESTRRMKPLEERQMLEHFDTYKEKMCKKE